MDARQIVLDVLNDESTKKRLEEIPGVKELQSVVEFSNIKLMEVGHSVHGATHLTYFANTTCIGYVRTEDVLRAAKVNFITVFNKCYNHRGTRRETMEISLEMPLENKDWYILDLVLRNPNNTE